MDQSSSSSSSRHLQFGGPGARTILDDGRGSSSLPDSQGYPENEYESQPMGTGQLSQQSRETHTTSPSLEGQSMRRVGGKANVSSACGPCKRAHLACDIGRPCKRCMNMGKQDQCEDVPVSHFTNFRSNLFYSSTNQLLMALSAQEERKTKDCKTATRRTVPSDIKACASGCRC